MIIVLNFMMAIAGQPVLVLPDDATTSPVAPAAASAPAEADALDQALAQLPKQLGVRDISDAELLRGLQDARLRAGHTVIGGYGQLNARALMSGPGNLDLPGDTTLGNPAYSATVRRLVLFVAHTFDLGKPLRVYTELEWENAMACRSCNGSVEIEQAFLEWALWQNAASRDVVALRGGLVLVPIGILNQWHEPPVFHGVERARLEEGGVIPSTWRELGVGVTGTPFSGVRYEAYLTTGLDPTRLSSAGLANARGHGALQEASSLMLSGRVEVEPHLGFLLGVSGVASEMSGVWLNANRFLDVNGKPQTTPMPLYMGEADARMRFRGIEARTVAVMAYMPASGVLMSSKKADGSNIFLVNSGETGAVPERMLGASLEFAYDVLLGAQLIANALGGGFSTEQQLLPFARVEYTEVQRQVPKGFVPDTSLNVKELTLGFSYRPIPNVVVKSDVNLRNRETGPDDVQVNGGLGFMF